MASDVSRPRSTRLLLRRSRGHPRFITPRPARGAKRCKRFPRRRWVSVYVRGRRGAGTGCQTDRGGFAPISATPALHTNARKRPLCASYRPLRRSTRMPGSGRSRACSRQRDLVGGGNPRGTTLATDHDCFSLRAGHGRRAIRAGPTPAAASRCAGYVVKPRTFPPACKRTNWARTLEASCSPITRQWRSREECSNPGP